MASTAQGRGDPATEPDVESQQGGGPDEVEKREERAETRADDHAAAAETTDTSQGPKEKREAENHEYLIGIKLWVLLGSLTLTSFLMLLDGSIIGTAVPSITSEFHSLPDVGWYVAGYQLASAALQPLTGKMFTYYSAKWTYFLFFALFELGSLICGLSTSSAMLIAGRAIAGLGGSGLLNGGITMIAGAVPIEKRPLYTGVYLGVIQVGLICGPVVGGALTEYATWRWCFYINLPIGAVAGVLLLLIRTPELTAKPRFTIALLRSTIPELDLIGFALFSPAAIMLLLALQFGGNAYPWDSAVVIGLFCGAGITAVLFLLWERRRGDRAMIPFGIVRRRVVYCSALNGAALVVAILVAAQYLPIYFQGVLGYQPAMSGVNLLPSILSQMAMVISTGALVQRLGYYLPFAVAGSAISAVGNGLVSTFSPLTPTATWIGYQIILGGGRGIGMQTGIIAVQNTLPAPQIPVAVAFLIFCQNFGAAILVVVANAIFTNVLTQEIASQAPSVPAAAALAAGASPGAVRGIAPAGSPELASVLRAFADSVARAFYLLVAVCLGGMLAALGMGWVDTRRNRKAPTTV